MPELFLEIQSPLFSLRLWFAANIAVELFSLLHTFLMRVAKWKGYQLCTDFIWKSEVQEFVDCPLKSLHWMSLSTLHKEF